MPLWIPITITAAFLQNLRSSLQRQLKGRMGSTGATFARFGFAFPFAVLYIVALDLVGGATLPGVNATFLVAVAAGGLAQILATFLLVYLFGFRNFMVGTAYSKTEPVQAAIFGLIILGETISWLAFGAILAGAFGVGLISIAGRKGGTSLRRALFSREAGIGIASGAFFGISAVCFRGASLSLEEGGVLARAATTLVWATGIQTAVMLVWMALKDRAELVAVAKAWRPALLVGLVGVSASACWFTAMTLEKVAYVRALGQIELIFTFASSVFWFREKIARLELAGCLLIVAGILTLLGTAT